MQVVAETVHSAESEEIAVANTLNMLRARLGWNSDTKLRASVFAHFSPVALAAFRVAPDSKEPAADVRKELTAFENWYARDMGQRVPGPVRKSHAGHAARGLLTQGRH
jgi:hypothetical protein